MKDNIYKNIYDMNIHIYFYIFNNKLVIEYNSQSTTYNIYMKEMKDE